MKPPHCPTAGVHLVDDDADYRIAVNVKSKQLPSELLYLIDENYAHPLVDGLKELPANFYGHRSGARRPGHKLHSRQPVYTG